MEKEEKPEIIISSLAVGRILLQIAIRLAKKRRANAEQTPVVAEVCK